MYLALGTPSPRSENKKVLEERCARYMAVSTFPAPVASSLLTERGSAVRLTLVNVEDAVSAHSVQLHPQRPEMGLRVLRRYRHVLLDQADAATFKVSPPLPRTLSCHLVMLRMPPFQVGEEITLLRWGNVKLTAIQTDGGRVVAMEVEPQ